jgi:prolipoprotein diacylglyceryltransferase
LFSVYLVAYGIFRFAMEFVRETPKTFGDYSGYQLLSLVMIDLGLIFLVRRTLVPLPNFESPPTTTAGTRPA